MPSRLPYSPSANTSRDATLDALRGAALVVMTINHLPGNPLRPYTFHPFGFFSAAFVFVFISGYVAAWRFTAALDRDEKPALFFRLLPALRRIWGAHILVLAAAVAFGRVPFTLLFIGAAFVGVFSVDGVLVLYLWLVPLLALVLPLFRRGRARMVACCSAALWFLMQTPLGPALSPSPTFNPFAWQALYLLGAYLGFRRTRNLPVHGPRMLTYAAAAFAIVLFWIRHQTRLDYDGHLHLGFGFDQAQLGFVRFFNFLVAGWAACALSRRLAPHLGSVVSRLARPLALWGRHSLTLYTAQVLIVMTCATLSSDNVPTRVVIAVCSLLTALAIYRDAATSHRTAHPSGAIDAVNQRHAA